MKRTSSFKASRVSSRQRRPNRQLKPIKLTSEHPELDLNHVVRVIVRKGLKPVLPKTSVSLRIDADVLDWYKSMGPGYQTRMNSVLRAYKEAAA
jgi:uncharacterized protein (DUF4415 family)